ncbi:MAG: sulfatase-like hydrolase/transferase [Saprospiraceae bacterium]|nr:sulfatase-like hydrolase/transferase [Saprospiraceae bacterium]
MKKFNLFIFILLAFTVKICAQRNTILIIADDLSPDYFGFYPNHGDTVDVPNLRKLKENGILFTKLSSNPVCSSTRAGILTGRYSFRTGVGGIVGGVGGSNQIDTAEISIPKLLKKYNPDIAKANIGKWHLKQPMPTINLTSPLALGYDWSEGPFIGQLPSFTNWQKYTNGVLSNVTTYATTENVNNMITWLKAQNKAKPFFIWLAFNAPHDPLHLPPADLHKFTNLTGTATDIRDKPKEYFKAMIQAMDREMGRLFDSLKVMNKLDSTDIIFIGDNGNSTRTAQIADQNKAKGTVYEYGVNVPMIISGPTVVNKGRISDALVNTADLFATIVENFGYTNWQSQIPSNKPVDSKSLLPIIKNQSDSIRPWAFSEIFKLTTDSADGKSIRDLQYKLIRFDYGVEEFYDLIADPLENKNLLSGKLNAIEVDRYNYLCNEMSKLVGGFTCKKLVQVKIQFLPMVIF